MADTARNHSKSMFGPAVNALQISLGIMKTNEPINRREGKQIQADLEHRNAASFDAAIKALKGRDK